MKSMQRSTAPDQRGAHRVAVRMSLLLAASMLCSAAVSQTAPAPASAPRTAAPATRVPPAMPAAKQPVNDPAPRTRIELPAAERAALESATAPAVPPAPPERNELLPQPDDAQLTIIEPSGTVVEQIRQSNRISEVRVTPAMTGHTWVMTNREGRQPIGATDTQPGLSVPKFFTFEFGGGPRQAATPAGPAAPPPPSTQSR